MNPDEYCRQKAVASGSSLHYSFLFLAPERRRAMTALHAFSRELRDVLVECSDAQIARTKLAWWRLEVGKLFEGKSNHPVTSALQPLAEQFQLTPGHLNHIIDGAEMDLAQTRYLDFAGLERYCHLAAGAESLAGAEICGYKNVRTLEYAKHLGTALQLTRIIRGVGEDARMNRIYLPVEDLRKFEVSAADLLKRQYSDNFGMLMAFQARRAEGFYDLALGLLPQEDRRAQRAGLILAAICRETLAEAEQDGFRVLTHRTSLTPLRKFWLAWKTGITA